MSRPSDTLTLDSVGPTISHQGVTIPRSTGERLHTHESQIAGRLGLVSRGLAGVHLVSLLLDLINRMMGYALPPQQTQKNVISVAMIAISLLVFMVARRVSFTRATLARLAIGYMVVVAFGIELSAQLTPWPPASVVSYQLVRVVSWVCLWIIIFAIALPLPRRLISVGALLAAASGPLALMLTGMLGNPLPGFGAAVFIALPNFIAAALAIWLNGTIYHLGGEARVGAYELRELLGAGGMGEVYRARHRLLGREVALKLINPRHRDGEQRELAEQRFMQEARAIAKLRSPRIVTLHDFGITADGHCFYAMELLEGLDAKQLVARDGPLSFRRAAALLVQISEGLAVAHAAGFLHRDIKPANIFICQDPSGCETVKLVDFGLVKSSDLQGLTLTAGLAGTPAYTAPEVALDSRRAGRPSDIYALGCVAFFLVTGRAVFAGDSAVDILYRQVHEMPCIPQGLLERPLPREFEALVLSCLAKAPSDRPASAEVLADLFASMLQ